jgi:hypothetical protein
MADTLTFYAWGDIRYGVPGKPGNVKVIRAGDTVTLKDFNGDETEFASLVDSRAIRTMPFPDDIPEAWRQSPMEWIRYKIRKATEGEDSDMVTYAMITDPDLRDAMRGANMQLPTDLPDGVETTEESDARKKAEGN